MLTHFADGSQVDGGALVGFAEFRQSIFHHRFVEAHEGFFFGLVVANANHFGIHIFDYAGAFSLNLCAAVVGEAFFNTRAHDRRFAAEQRHSLAHHVGTHQSTVGVVVLQEGNHGSCNRRYLLRRHVHQFHLARRHHGEVGFEARLHLIAHESAIIVERRIALCDDFAFFAFSGEINDVVVVEIHFGILHFTIRCFDKAEFIDFGVDTE